MDLRVLINVEKNEIDLPRLAQVLDDLGHAGRLWATRSWSRKHQSKLFEAAKGFRALTLDDFVPADTPPLVEVIHDGTNTLPVFSHFQKRFCKPSPPDADQALWGFNYQALSPLTGPGFFVAQPGDPGQINIDYTRTPSAKPASWPPILSNNARLGRFVYAGMVDVMRGISSHVTIGRAKKPVTGSKEGAAKSEFIDAWFVLVRQDVNRAP